VTSGQERVQCACCICISCVPRSPLHVYHTKMRSNVFLHLPRPNRTENKPAAQQGTTHTPNITTRSLTSVLNGYMEGKLQRRERYNPRLSPTTMTRQQCSRQTSNRGTLLSKLFVLLSETWHTTVTYGNLP
jgi:hypothetical protein